MNTKQAELIGTLLSQLSEGEKRLCEPVIEYLLALGYIPKKHKKSTFVVSFEKKGRIIVKLEYGKQYQADPAPFLSFWLRYSASDDYSSIFQKPIIDLMETHKKKHGARMGEFDIDRCCGLCKDNPRLYTHVWPDGTKDSWCGGFTMRFSDLTFEDVPEILRHIKNQDAFFEETLNL